VFTAPGVTLIVKRYFSNICLARHGSLYLLALILLAVTSETMAGEWAPIAKDGLRDPSGPGVALLQDPNEGLAGLPPDKVGNKVNWIKAIEQGVISPRRFPTPPGEKSTQELAETIIPEIMLDTKGSMARVLFPHKKHTLWLECFNCHGSLMGTPAFFEPKLGANDIRMYKILSGEQCGRCHGAVSFPPVNCSRCHSVPHTDAKNDPAAGIPKARP
jgi:c(7)-type cytochrome triheme protein